MFIKMFLSSGLKVAESSKDEARIKLYEFLISKGESTFDDIFPWEEFEYINFFNENQEEYSDIIDDLSKLKLNSLQSLWLLKLNSLQSLWLRMIRLGTTTLAFLLSSV